MSASPGNAARHAGLAVNLAGLGQVRLTMPIAQNPETVVYRTDHPGVVVKVFDLACGRADEIGYGPYVNFQAELANYEEILAHDDLRAHVPAYYGAHIDYDAKYAFIALEFLDGPNLRNWAEDLAQGGYPPEALEELRRAAFEAMGILGLFHRHGFVVIDFKPDNVIRLHTGAVKFVDLGACYAPRYRTEPAKFVYAATPDHAEVLIDASNLQAGVPPTPATDVFSAGVALFEMATGETRLAIDAATAEDMLATPAIYRFRDSQIADVWKAFPHLREALPTVQTQLRERRLLFSELWHLLKAFVGARVADWDTLAPEQQDQVLVSTGMTFIMEQLPAPLGWLGAAIARATVLRSLRVPDMGELVRCLSCPAPAEALEDIATHNGLVRQLASLDLPVDFAGALNSWEVRLDPTTGHWAVGAPRTAAELGDNAGFVYLRQAHTDDEGHEFWQVVDEFDADVLDGAKACVAQFARNHRVWLGAGAPPA